MRGVIARDDSISGSVLNNRADSTLRSNPLVKYHILGILCAGVLSGCSSNTFTQHYRPNADVSIAGEMERLMPYSGKYEILSSSDLEKDSMELVRRGYLQLGVANFESGLPGPEAAKGIGFDSRAKRWALKQLQDQAVAVGADVVLTVEDYKGSELKTVSTLNFTPPKTSTTEFAGTVRATGVENGNYATGAADFSGVSTTSTPGVLTSETRPVAVRRYARTASFWRKARPAVLGVTVAQLPDEMRRILRRNSGLLVTIVENDSPAFHANIVPGDVIVRIDSADVPSAQAFGGWLRQFADKPCKVVILREGQMTEIDVGMNPAR